MKEAEIQAENRRESFEDVKDAYDDIHMSTLSSYGKIFREQLQSDSKATRWQKRNKDAQLVRKVVSGINKGVTLAGKFRAELRIDMAQKRAQRKAVEGEYDASRRIMRRAEEKSIRTMKATDAINTGTRAVAHVGIKLGKLPVKLIQALDNIGQKNVEFSTDENQLYSKKTESMDRMYMRTRSRGKTMSDLRSTSNEVNKMMRNVLISYEPKAEQSTRRTRPKYNEGR